MTLGAAHHGSDSRLEPPPIALEPSALNDALPIPLTGLVAEVLEPMDIGRQCLGIDGTVVFAANSLDLAIPDRPAATVSIWMKRHQ
jgi:hypothetical protein